MYHKENTAICNGVKENSTLGNLYQSEFMIVKILQNYNHRPLTVTIEVTRRKLLNCEIEEGDCLAQASSL